MAAEKRKSSPDLADGFHDVKSRRESRPSGIPTDTAEKLGAAMASGFVRKFHHDTLPPRSSKPPPSKPASGRVERAEDVVAVGTRPSSSPPQAVERHSFIHGVVHAKLWRSKVASWIALGVAIGFALAFVVVAIMVFSG